MANGKMMQSCILHDMAIVIISLIGITIKSFNEILTELSEMLTGPKFICSVLGAVAAAKLITKKCHLHVALHYFRQPSNVTITLVVESFILEWS